ncbi:hypothetical protein J6590_005084 [Homalodisca vitripennis]|nr:hypothetical protein J6590_005084 [Homalodisca vitripennis]
MNVAKTLHFSPVNYHPLSQDNRIKQRRAWLLLGSVTAGDPVLASSLPGRWWWFGSHR